MHKRSSQQGFTLIELLIVIVIIGILAAIVLQVINPARQQRRSREAVLRANTNKACLSLFACAATAETAAECDSWPELGIELSTATGNPPLMQEAILNSQFGVGPDSVNTNIIEVYGHLPTSGAITTTCTFMCSYNFNDGTTINMVEDTANRAGLGASACL